MTPAVRIPADGGPGVALPGNPGDRDGAGLVAAAAAVAVAAVAVAGS